MPVWRWLGAASLRRVSHPARSTPRGIVCGSGVDPGDWRLTVLSGRCHAVVEAPDAGTVTVRVGRHAIVEAPDARSIVHWTRV